MSPNIWATFVSRFGNEKIAQSGHTKQRIKTD